MLIALVGLLVVPWVGKHQPRATAVDGLVPSSAVFSRSEENRLQISVLFAEGPDGALSALTSTSSLQVDVISATEGPLLVTTLDSSGRIDSKYRSTPVEVIASAGVAGLLFEWDLQPSAIENVGELSIEVVSIHADGSRSTSPDTPMPGATNSIPTESIIESVVDARYDLSVDVASVAFIPGRGWETEPLGTHAPLVITEASLGKADSVQVVIAFDAALTHPELAEIHAVRELRATLRSSVAGVVLFASAEQTRAGWVVRGLHEGEPTPVNVFAGRHGFLIEWAVSNEELLGTGNLGLDITVRSVASAGVHRFSIPGRRIVSGDVDRRSPDIAELLLVPPGGWTASPDARSRPSAPVVTSGWRFLLLCSFLAGLVGFAMFRTRRLATGPHPKTEESADQLVDEVPGRPHE